MPPRRRGTLEAVTTNDWCRVLAIAPPELEAVAGHREANTFALLLVALLERGEAMTLAQVAARFEEAGIAERSRALRSLQRCQPARAPVYRDGDVYSLDPHDHDLDLWAFRLGLRPPRIAAAAPTIAKSSPLPGPDVALGQAELDEAWKDAPLMGWSAQRLVLAVLDAGGGPLAPADVVAAVAGRTTWHSLFDSPAKFKRRGSAIEILEDGRWAIAADAGETLKQARAAVRERVALVRRNTGLRTDPAEVKRIAAEWTKRRQAHGAELSAMSRALLVAFPPARPAAAALLDVGEHEITTFVGDELDAMRARLAGYDIIGAVGVRALLRAIDVDPGDRRLAELGPPQKTKKLNQRGRTLEITTALLVQGSCGIGKPFGDPDKIADYLARGETTKLRRRLEADVKSLYALYEYGRLHGAVRLRWGFLDEHLLAPWVHHDEPTLHDLEKSALAMKVPVEVVVGAAPGWADPWSRVRLAYVESDVNGWRTWLVADDGISIDEADVQRARLSETLH